MAKQHTNAPGAVDPSPFFKDRSRGRPIEQGPVAPEPQVDVEAMVSPRSRRVRDPEADQGELFERRGQRRSRRAAVRTVTERIVFMDTPRGAQSFERAAASLEQHLQVPTGSSAVMRALRLVFVKHRGAIEHVAESLTWGGRTVDEVQLAQTIEEALRRAPPKEGATS
jgi:hypothetical protein